MKSEGGAFVWVTIGRAGSSSTLCIIRQPHRARKGNSPCFLLCFSASEPKVNLDAADIRDVLLMFLLLLRENVPLLLCSV